MLKHFSDPALRSDIPKREPSGVRGCHPDFPVHLHGQRQRSSLLHGLSNGESDVAVKPYEALSKYKANRIARGKASRMPNMFHHGLYSDRSRAIHFDSSLQFLLTLILLIL